MKLLPPALVTLALTGVALAQTSTPPPPPTASATTPPPATEPPPPPPPPPASRIIYGGGVGMSFGDVDYIEISPMIGYKLTPKTHVGITLLYRYRDDSRYDPDLTTSDYGGSVFARYFPLGGFFIQGEYEWINYEYVSFDGFSYSNDRQGDSNWLAGGGFSQSMGGHASFFISAMYNFGYDEDDFFEPYDSPWVIRVGVGFGF
jgi:hypothetical protein